MLDLDQNSFTLCWCFLKEIFEEVNFEEEKKKTKNLENFPSMQRIQHVGRDILC